MRDPKDPKDPLNKPLPPPPEDTQATLRALVLGQLNDYCDQLKTHIGTSFQKLFVAQQLVADSETE